MITRTILRSLLVAAAGAALAVPVLAQPAAAPPASQPATKPVDPNTVVFQVGEQKMTAKQFDDLLSELPPMYRQNKRLFADQLAQMKMMAAEAQQRKLDQTPQFKQQMDLMRDNALASALVQNLSKSIGEDALKKYYEEHKGEFSQVKARHILIATEGSPAVQQGKKGLSDADAKAKAEDLRKRIEKGEDFAALAKAESDDTGSGAQGGELGFFGRKQMVPAFEESAFSMKENELSQPIKTPFGYHLIQVQEKKSPTFEEMKQSIEARLGPEQLQKLLEELKKKNPTKLNDDYFGPASTLPAGMDIPAPE